MDHLPIRSGYDFFFDQPFRGLKKTRKKKKGRKVNLQELGELLPSGELT